jgi:hypothetical protein
MSLISHGDCLFLNYIKTMYVWLVDRDQLKLVCLRLNLQNISKEFYRKKKESKKMDEILVRFFPHRLQRRQQEEGRKKRK